MCGRIPPVRRGEDVSHFSHCSCPNLPRHRPSASRSRGVPFAIRHRAVKRNGGRMGTRALKLMGTVMLLAWPMRAAADPISIIAATRRLAVLAKVTDANGSDRHTLIQEQGDALTAAT